MDFEQATRLVLSTSVMLIVFSLGLQATLQDATYLFRQPQRFLRSLLAMSLIMPVFAAILVEAMALPEPVKITLIVLSVSPVPPVLPKKELAAGGCRSYALGLLVAAAITSILFVPTAVEVFGRVFGRPAQISPVSIGRIVMTTVLGPLAAGLAFRSLFGGFAQRWVAPLSRLGILLLIAGVLPVLWTQRSAAISLIGDGTLLAMTAFVTVGFAAGAVLGGPERAYQIVLALSTALRHPGIAMAIASASFPGQRFVLPAILLYLIVAAIVSGILLRWLRGNPRESVELDRHQPAA
jgi:BASS family bile acid:Na+ symporter